MQCRVKIWLSLSTIRSSKVMDHSKPLSLPTSSLCSRVVIWTPNSSAFSFGAKIERVLKAASACLNRSSMSNLQQNYIGWSPEWSTWGDKPHGDSHFDFLLQFNRCSLHVVVFPQRFQFSVCHIQHSWSVKALLLKVLPRLKIVRKTILALLCFFVGHLEKSCNNCKGTPHRKKIFFLSMWGVL